MLGLEAPSLSGLQATFPALCSSKGQWLNETSKPLQHVLAEHHVAKVGSVVLK